MIKKFDEFCINSVKNSEQEHFERELNSRKKMREESISSTDLSFDDMKDFITNEIENQEDYHITTGKKIVDFNKTKKEEIHIEYQSPEAGRIKIFKPEDESNKGYYEINGKMFDSNADDIRIFYHFLNQYIKNKPIE